MRLTKTRKRIRIAFVLIGIVAALSGEGTVTVFQAAKASPEAQISIVSDEKPELVKGTQEGKEVAPNATGSLPSKDQKDVVAKVCAKHFSGRVLTQCYYDLLAIAYTESRFDNEAVGDKGKSFGAYQIYTNVHKHISREQANDFEWAANWTLERMISQGFPVYRSWSLGSHNSLTPEVNARYSKMVKEKSAEFERAGL